MSILQRVFGGLFGGRQSTAGAGGDALWLYVRCAACGERIRVRISRQHDLSAEFDGDGDLPIGYRVHKEIVGQNCFRRIQVDVSFDARKGQTDQQISGGSFITREEFEAEGRTGDGEARPRTT